MGEVVSRLEEVHPDLRPFFGTNVGHRVQFTESEILVDVLLRLKDQDILALPIHDAIIVTHSSVPNAETAMEEVFEEHTGVEGMVREEG